MFKIREIEIPNKVVLAPMAGVCNAAFRLTAKEFGAGLVCAEMVSDKAILFNNQKTMNMLYIDPRERPLSLQIFGGEIYISRSSKICRQEYRSRYYRFEYGMSSTKNNKSRCRK